MAKIERNTKQRIYLPRTTKSGTAIPDDAALGELFMNISSGNGESHLVFRKSGDDSGKTAVIREQAWNDEHYAAVDGNYPEMSVGIADDLGGRPFVDESAFTFRASAGDENSIKDDLATITNIKGNSLVYNQLFDLTPQNGRVTKNGANIENDGYVVKATLNDNAVSNRYGGPGFWLTNTEWQTNHTYLFIIDDIKYSEGINEITIGNSFGNVTILANGVVNKQIIVTTKTISSPKICYVNAVGELTTGEWFELYGFRVHDLTQMFDDGNEPTTIEEFYARIPSGVDMKEYNPGEIISVNAEEIKTVGFNVWDEQWEMGQLNTGNGELSNNSVAIRSKNFIPVIGGETYNFHCTRTDISLYFRVVMYDANKKFIGVIPSGVYPSTSTVSANYHNPWKFDSNVRYIKFDLAPAYGTTYNNDVCINLSHSGYRNGEYAPYNESIKDLTVIKKYFPNGMRSAGSVCDEIRHNITTKKWEAVKKIGEIDLGTFDWVNSWTNDSTKHPKRSTVGISDAKGANASNIKANILCDKYIPSAIDSAYMNKPDTIGVSQEGKVIIYDETYNKETDIDSFKQSLQGTKLYYELAEPIITEIEEAIDFSYYVEDFGTEEIISSVPSAPFRANIEYNFNANDTIRQNKLNIAEISNATETLGKSLIDVEYVIANAITKINNSAGFDENGNSTLEGGKSLTEAIKGIEDDTFILDFDKYFTDDNYVEDESTITRTTYRFTIDSNDLNAIKNATNFKISTNGTYVDCTYVTIEDDYIAILGEINEMNEEISEEIPISIMIKTSIMLDIDLLNGGQSYGVISVSYTNYLSMYALSALTCEELLTIDVTSDTLKEDVNGRKYVEFDYDLYDKVSKCRGGSLNYTGSVNLPLVGVMTQIPSDGAKSYKVEFANFRTNVSTISYPSLYGDRFTMEVYENDRYKGYLDFDFGFEMGHKCIESLSASTVPASGVKGTLSSNNMPSIIDKEITYTSLQYFQGGVIIKNGYDGPSSDGSSSDDSYDYSAELRLDDSGISVKGYTYFYDNIEAPNIVNKVKINGQTKTPTNGIVDLGTITVDVSGKLDSATAESTYAKKADLQVLEASIVDSEEVIAKALNRLNDSAGFDDNGNSTLRSGVTLTQAIVDLQNKVGEGSDKVMVSTALTKNYLIGREGIDESKSSLYSNSKVWMENGQVYATSDKTLKEHVGNVDGDLEKIKRIPKVLYNWKDDDVKRVQIGTYAQDVEEVYPEIVSREDDGTLAVGYDRLSIIALAGIDKLYEMVQELKEENKRLRDELNTLKK